MKRSVLVVLMLMTAGMSYGQTWYTANSHTFGWDVVDTATSYRTFLKPWKGGEMLTTVEVTTPQATVTLTVEGRFYPCVQAVRVPEGETEPLLSDVVCSDVAVNCQNGNIFGFRYFVPPGNPHNLR